MSMTLLTFIDGVTRPRARAFRICAETFPLQFGY
jgi:hypothetical protein